VNDESLLGSFPSRLPFNLAAVDRDYLARKGGIEPLLAEESARLLLIYRGQVLLVSAEGAAPRPALLAPTGLPDGELTFYVGRRHDDRAPLLARILDEEAYEALTGSDLLPGEAAWGDLRQLGAMLDLSDSGLLAQAVALANWHASGTFSPHTGQPTEVTYSGWVRRDPTTGREYFPRTDPCVIVGVVGHDDRILLGSNKGWEGKGFSVLAGFVEPGETLEGAVEREIFEESGLRVVEPRYLGSQPWPFPASLMLGFTARLAPDQDPTPVPDGEEISELRWFSREELLAAARAGDIRIPGPTSISRALIEHWYGGPIDDGQR